jgi:hypothetical protein
MLVRHSPSRANAGFLLGSGVSLLKNSVHLKVVPVFGEDFAGQEFIAIVIKTIEVWGG